MSRTNVVILERESLVARDMGEEIATLDPDAALWRAGSVEEALDHARALGRVDLLIVSPGPETLVNADLPRLTGMARALLVMGSEEEWSVDHPEAHAALAPFTSASLRRDLLNVSVAGVPLFPQRSPAPVRSPARPCSGPGC